MPGAPPAAPVAPAAPAAPVALAAGCCELCARALEGGDRAPYITRLLLAESGGAVCRACRAKEAEKPREARALHVVNELVTPAVDYETWREFAELVYAVQDRYCACLEAAVRLALRREQVSRVLGSFYDFCGFPLELEHLRTHGPAIILELTKGQGAFWCNMVAHLVYTRATRAAAIFGDVLASLADGDDERARGSWSRAETVAQLVEIMQQEVRHTFSGAMPFSIYTLCSGFVSTLLVKNFTFYDDRDLTAFTDSQFRALLLALCMGAHPRLGARSPLLALHDDLLQSVCARLPASQLMKHIVFHTQEQWLVA
jgi:hypothetical protein